MTKYSLHLFIVFYYMANASFLPYLGYWFMQNGLSSQQIGLISSVGTMVGLLAQPMWGMLSDRFGAEKRILMLCIFASTLLAFGYLLADRGFILLIVTAMCYSFFFTAITPLSDTITVNHAKLHQQSYGSIRVLGSLSFALIMTPIGWIYQGFGTEAMFFVQLFFMGMVLIALSFVQVPQTTRDVQRRSLFTGFGVLLKQRFYVIFLIAVFLMGIGHHFNNVFFSVYIGQFGGEASQRIGILNAVSALSELPLFLLSAYLIGRFGFYKLLSFTAIASAVRWWVLSMEPAFYILVLNQLLHGITFALFIAVCVTFVNQVSPDSYKNTGQSLFAVVYMSLANIIASNVGGYMIDHYDFRTLFGSGSILSLLGLLGFVVLTRYIKRHPIEQPSNG